MAEAELVWAYNRTHTNKNNTKKDRKKKKRKRKKGNEKKRKKNIQLPCILIDSELQFKNDKETKQKETKTT